MKTYYRLMANFFSVKKWSFFCVFFFISFKLCAQKPFSIPPVIPPSPNVGSLFKFIENPVSTYTGLPEISIPVYTISNKGLNIPISLSYHSGGVKVADAASWVGMGWALQAGGVITQSARGIKDDHIYGRFNTTPANLNALLDPDICVLKKIVDGQGDSEPDVFSFSFNGKSGQFYFNDSGGIVQVPVQKFKIEANISGSAPGRKIGSWKVTDVDGTQYFFDQTELVTSQGKALNGGVLLGDGEIGNYPVEDQKSWMLTSIIQANSDVISFSYETYSAVDCIFNSETRTYRNYVHSDPIHPNTSVQLLYTKNFNKQIIHTGKRLKSIQFPDGRIEFVSGSGRCDLYGDKFLDKIQVFNLSNQKVKEVDLEYNYFEGSNRYPTNVVNCTADAPPEVGALNNFKDRRLFLMSVSERDENGNPNGSYSLDYETSLGLPNRFSAEQDHWGFYNGNGYTSLLQNIQLSNQYLDGFQLHNIYGRNPSLVHTKQGTLTKITYPTGGYTTYDYELNSLTSSLVPTSKPYPEVNFSVSGANTPQFLQNISVMGTSATLTFEVDKCIFGPNTTTVGFYIADVNNNVVVSGSQVTSDLQSSSGTGVVSYMLNTGQYKLYSYAALPFPCTYNIKIRAWTDQLPAQDNYDSGGLRIKKITNYDPVTNANTSKAYSYTEWIGGKELSTGQYAIPAAEFRNQYVSWMSEGVEVLSGGCSDYYSKVYTLQSSTNYPLASNQNNSVGYLKVTEKSIDGSGTDLGYVNYEFTGGTYNSSENPTFAGSGSFSLSGNDKYPWVPAPNTGWTRGKPLKIEYFRREGAGYRLVKAQTNTYSSAGIAIPYTNAFSASYAMQSQCGTIIATCANDVKLNDAFRYSRYKLGSGCLLLSSEKTEEIDENNNTLSTLISYEYNPDNFLPSKVTTTNSVAGSTIQFTKYPSDYTGITAVDPLSAGIKALKDAYVLDKPIEQFTQRVVNNTNVGTVQALFNSYKNSNLQPEKIFVAKITKPLIDFALAQVQSGAVTKDSRYESRALFNQYDAYDNIVEQQIADGAKEVYLWGYNGRYLVAKVIGSDYATVAALVNLSILNNPSSDLQLRNELNNIRVNLPNAMVNTYTYKPLVGMTSSTDPKGMITTYEYDSSQRLKTIKDQDGNIVKNYNYHYKP